MWEEPQPEQPWPQAAPAVRAGEAAVESASEWEQASALALALGPEPMSAWKRALEWEPMSA